ncbi:TlpA family protein disulfide reductase [Corynebacterium sp. 320]|uniref:TlpA disulfide reductase family protein n=1 Tax=Corynebacterium TaxID=1716 RepID=UPI00125CC684|nr:MULTISPECIES: TlpA disulfide reductase family protein [Corynebacterium]KAB1502878.1 TlpA family protein disulfide reductase [Corynebacterium sp. 320]KAB1552389.1 TlpA family protein disulfide reductase [Corynebacterium sp. 321]KAB1554396.1 TlpA family protein disulfide reductase [Corynebacterium sp. 319]KAB3526541.1 TlpA family protein disulfide reductase [Corynebacterium sp. 250]KAB3539861.1 TlpA family protein disulfide reductase [Corynebacterium sp. 366]
MASEEQNNPVEQPSAEQPPRASAERRTRIIIVAVTVIVGLIVAAIPLIASMTSPSGTSHGTAHSAEGTGAAADSAYPGNAQDPQLKDVSVDTPVACPEAAQHPLDPSSELADVTLPCLTTGGQPTEHSLGQQLAGKVSVVNVWAWWCGPCREELPIMNAVRHSHPEWNVVGVHMAQEAQAGVDFLKTTGATDLPSYQDSSHTFDTATKIPQVVPITLVYREDGTRAGMFTTAFTSEEQLVTAVTNALHNEKN